MEIGIEIDNFETMVGMKAGSLPSGIIRNMAEVIKLFA
jgi:hypothetical protein